MQKIQIGCPSDPNEFSAIRIAVIKAIASLAYNRRGKVSHVPTVSVDMPCSQGLFVEKFIRKIPNMEYIGQDNFKCMLNPSDLDAVFGENWNLYHYKNSFSRRRAFGLIVIHFRKKKVCLSDGTLR